MSRLAEACRRGSLAAVLVLHLGLVLRLASLPDLASGRPLGAIDYQNHYYEAIHARERFHRDGSLLGYDPYWMAGYPEGLFGLIENRLFYLVAIVSPSGAEAVVFNFLVVALLVTIPLATLVAARAAGHSPAQATASTALAVVATFTVPIVVKCWVLGMISFLVCAVWFVPALVFLGRAIAGGSLADRGAKLGIALAAFSALAHAGSGVVFAPGLLVALFSARRRSLRVLVPLCAAIGAVFLLLNLPALVALAGLHGELHESWAQRFLQGGIRELRNDLLFRLLRTDRTKDTGLGGLAALLVLACAAIRAPRFEQARPLVAIFWVSAASFFFLAYFSSAWEAFASIQPYRFLVPLAFLLCLPAGRGLAYVLERRGALGLVAGAIAVVFVAESARALVPPAALGTGVDPGEAAVVRLLREHSYRNERILVETSGHVLPAFGGTARTIFTARFSLLPLAIDRECVGSILPGAILRESYAGFVFDRVLGRPLASMPDPVMRDLFATYAIAWVVAWREPSIRELRTHPALLEEVGEADGVVVFRVRDASSSRVLEGKGGVTSGLDRIDVKDAEGERIVLKYHWSPTLVTEPPLPIHESPLPGSPVGFIAVERTGARSFSVVPR